METRYYCEDCDRILKEENIAYKYVLNVSGKYPVTNFVCKECAREEDGE